MGIVVRGFFQFVLSTQHGGIGHIIIQIWDFWESHM
jgi:hypothetical protein